MKFACNQTTNHKLKIVTKCTMPQQTQRKQRCFQNVCEPGQNETDCIRKLRMENKREKFNEKCRREEIKIANENGIDGDEKNGNNK